MRVNGLRRVKQSSEAERLKMRGDEVHSVQVMIFDRQDGSRL